MLAERDGREPAAVCEHEAQPVFDRVPTGRIALESRLGEHGVVGVRQQGIEHRGIGHVAIGFARRANRTESAELIAAFARAQQPKGKW